MEVNPEKNPQPTDPLLPRHTTPPTFTAARSTRQQYLLHLLLSISIYGSALLFIGHYFYSTYYGSHNGFSGNTTVGPYERGQFFACVKRQSDLCPGDDGVKKAAQSGYIGIEGDSEEEPRRSFFGCLRRSTTPRMLRSC